VAALEGPPFRECTVIGVDCATDPRKVGLALGRLSHNGLTLERLATGERDRPVAETILSWLDGSARVLLAIDAPLGWPEKMGEVLSHHAAGAPVGVEANRLFRRHTDRIIKERLGKQPLDVGADRIARTAVAALEILEALRRQTGHPLPLAWAPDYEGPIAAIEVYPAGTLTRYGLPATGYKKGSDRARRQTILHGLEGRWQLGCDGSPLLESADVLDAAICVLAGCDFLRGKAVAPSNPDLARKEGWIWV
jgi:predicted RNase H-like nuclease